MNFRKPLERQSEKPLSWSDSKEGISEFGAVLAITPQHSVISCKQQDG
jgi:hypothetical protein